MQTDLVATWQSVHLHQLTLRIKHQLSEGEQLRGEGDFGEVGVDLAGVPKLLQRLEDKNM